MTPGRTAWTARAAAALLPLAGPALSAGARDYVRTPLARAARVEKVAELPGIPWGFDFLSEERLLVSVKDGRMFIADLAGGGALTQVAGVPESTVFGQGGLMDVRLRPDGSGTLFFTYVAAYGGGRGTVLARARLAGARLLDVRELFRASPPGTTGRHFGSRIVLADGMVLFGVGDRGERALAQDPALPNGKILRIREDGSVPPDNPFPGSPVWSLGHRNPQGMATHPGTGALWEQEHGPRGGDEINIVEKGKNYGWPVATYGKEYWGPSIGRERVEGTSPPVKYFVPSIAPASLMIHSGKLFPQWRHHVFSAALKRGHINRLAFDAAGRVAQEERLVPPGSPRVRHLREAPSGAILFSTDAGGIYRMTPLPRPR